MTDLVKRLANEIAEADTGARQYFALKAAKARIEQQAAEIARLRAQLEDRVHDC